MGSWSEACIISGLEIQEGNPCYLATLEPNRWDSGTFIISRPPIKGIYDDYGNLKLLENSEYLDVKIGELYNPDDATAYNVFIDGEVFEFLPKIVRDYCFKPGNSTVEDERKDHVEEIRKALAAQIEFLTNMKTPSDEKAKVETMMGLLKANQAVSDLIGSHRDSVWRSFPKTVQTYTEQKKSTDEILMLYGRCFDLVVGASELRKALAPSNRGPQHGGHQALIPFYEHVLSVARDRHPAFSSDGVFEVKEGRAPWLGAEPGWYHGAPDDDSFGPFATREEAVKDKATNKSLSAGN